jgi:hypothetical protein
MQIKQQQKKSSKGAGIKIKNQENCSGTEESQGFKNLQQKILSSANSGSNPFAVSETPDSAIKINPTSKMPNIG